MSSNVALDVTHSSGPPVDDLAREAWLMERAADGDFSLLVTSWRGPVVVLGYAQKPDEADTRWCRSQGMPVMRRLTGGTGVIHRGDLGIGLALPADHPWAKGVVGLYGRFLDVVEPALRSLGSRVARLEQPDRASRVRSPVCFLDQLSDTLAVDGKKAVGCAQTRRRGAVLVHAAVLLGVDAALYERVFGVRRAEVRAGLAPALEGVDPFVIGEAVTEAFAAALGLEISRSHPGQVPDRFLEPYSTPRWAPVR